MANIHHAATVGAITNSEAMRLTQHYTLGRRAAMQNTSNQDKGQLGDIALKVRLSLKTKREY
tara:strand:- start:75 stop:260 length:186 start_codon:yes stop_codon:yes gene_type:complete